MAFSRRWLGIGSILALVSTSAYAPDFSVLLGGNSELQRQLDVAAASSARSAQAFGTSLTAMDRQDLQATCTALVANPRDAQAQARLQTFLSRYKDNDPAAVLRFCLDPAISRLNDELQASRQGLERMTATRAVDDGRNAPLESTLQRQQRTFSSISNVMKTRHDTAKNSISNVR